jgi:hypothetical protein
MCISTYRFSFHDTPKYVVLGLTISASSFIVSKRCKKATTMGILLLAYTRSLTTTDLSTGDRADPGYSQVHADAEDTDYPEDISVVD